MAYGLRLPIFEGPDEASHFLYINHILETGEIPLIQSKDQIATESESTVIWNTLAHHPPLYYWLSSWLVAGLDRLDIDDYLVPNRIIFEREPTPHNTNLWLHSYQPASGDTAQAVYILRGFNMLIGALTLLLIKRGSFLLVQDETFSHLVMLIPLTIPSFVLASATISNDMLLIFFYTSAVVWALNYWRKGTLSRWDYAIVPIILSATILTKISGVTVILALYGMIFIMLVQRKIGIKQGVFFTFTTLTTALLLTSPWFIRNWQIYQDPLTIEVTQALWARDVPLNIEILLSEILRIGKSFWILIGHLNSPVYLPNYYYIYVLIFTVTGLGMSLRSFKERPEFRLPIVWLWGICLSVIGFMIYGTLIIDISYGRLLLPFILPFTILLAIGWYRLNKFLAFIVLVPLLIGTLWVPLNIFPQAYPTLNQMDTFPTQLEQIRWSNDSKSLAVEFVDSTITRGDDLIFDFYFQGNLPKDTIISFYAIDSLRITRLGYMENYLGRLNAITIDPSTVYQIRTHLPLTADILPDPPRLIFLRMELVDLDTGEILDAIEVQGPMLIDNQYQTEPLKNPFIDAVDDEITIDSYDYHHSIEDQTLEFQLRWCPQSTLPNIAFVLSIVDIDGQEVNTITHQPYWYPSSLWVEALCIVDRFHFNDFTLRDDYSIRIDLVQDEGQILNSYVVAGISRQ